MAQSKKSKKSKVSKKSKGTQKAKFAKPKVAQPKVKVAKTKAKAKTIAKTKAKIKATGAKVAPKKSSAKLKLVSSRRDFSALLTPLDDRLVVEVASPQEVSAGGIILTASPVKRPNEGVVVAVGRGHQDKKGRIRPMDLEPGDRVMFAEYSGTQVEVDGQDLLILRESDVLGVLGN